MDSIFIFSLRSHAVLIGPKQEKGDDDLWPVVSNVSLIGAQRTGKCFEHSPPQTASGDEA